MTPTWLPSLAAAALLGCGEPPGERQDPSPPADLTVLRLGARLAGSDVEDPRISQDHTLMDGAMVAPGRVRRVEIEVPPGQAELRFAITVVDPGEDTQRCLETHEFGIDVAPLGQPDAVQRVFHEALARVDRYQYWHWRRVSLADFEGQRLAVQLRLGEQAGTDPGCASIQGAFGDLQLVAGAVPSQPLPDLLVVVVDTMRGDHVGYLEAAPVRTPNLRRWAEEGVWFSDALATSSWTRESVHDLLTGTYRNLGHVQPEGRSLNVSDRPPSIVSLLRQQGYRTLALVANPILEPPDDLQGGFDVFHAVEDAEARAALDALLEGSDPRQPVFLYLHLMGPHLDYCYRDELSAPHFEAVGQPANPRDCLKVERDPSSWTPALRARAQAYYRGEVEHADHVAGLALEALDARDAGRSPWLFFTADHGEEFWDHDGYEHGHTMYQELLRVPLLVRPGDPGPWRIGRNDDPVSLVDVAHTIAALTGLAPLERPAGRSLIPTMQGEPITPGRVRLASGTIYGPARAATVIEGRKEIWNLGWTTELPTMEAFDLVADPLELSPLVSEGEPPPASGSAWSVFRDLAVTGQVALRIDLAPTGAAPLELQLDFPGAVQLAWTEPQGARVQLERQGSQHHLRVSADVPTTLWLQLDGVQERHRAVTMRTARAPAVDWPAGATLEGDTARVPLPWDLYRPQPLADELADGQPARVRWAFPQGAVDGGAHPDTSEALRALGYVE